MCAKRLEKGRFHWPVVDHARSVTMRAEELAMLVNRLDLKQLPRVSGIATQRKFPLEPFRHSL